jgi:hypothetical protein
MSFWGRGLPALADVFCGYFCQAIGSPGQIESCGTVDAHGVWQFALELPRVSCFAFIPMFFTDALGSCVPSVP